MLHPLNMSQGWFTITTDAGKTRRVSSRKYRLIGNHPDAGKIVRMVSLDENQMPGTHWNPMMVVVALDSTIKNGFDESHETKGVTFKELTPLSMTT